MWTNKKPVKPWKFNTRREECECSQYAPLRITGMAEKQGPTHYCPICRWAFWPILHKPSADQISLMKQKYPEANEQNMSYIKMCNKPEPPTYSRSSTKKHAMIDQLGKDRPYFLTERLRKYWLALYCKKYPESDIAKHVKELQKEKERRYR
jgi:hypothetical protein